MKPFVFKLQTALDLKLKEEEAQKEQLQRATRIYQENLEHLQELQTQLKQVHDIIRGKQLHKVDVSELQNCHGYMTVLDGRIKLQEAATEAAQNEMEQVRSRLIEKMRERKVLEKLKSKHYQEYMKEFLRDEQKQIDEMATVVFVRRDPAV